MKVKKIVEEGRFRKGLHVEPRDIKENIHPNILVGQLKSLKLKETVSARRLHQQSTRTARRPDENPAAVDLTITEEMSDGERRQLSRKPTPNRP